MKKRSSDIKADSTDKPVAIEQEPLAKERIAKRLARAGLCSRRVAETWILDGRVRVNGVVLESPAFTVSQRDRIEVDDKPLAASERTRLWLFHKPAGVVTTSSDPEGRRTVFDLFPEELPRVITVGRLDINTEGLLLLTNDGGLARVLELPATGWLRRYRVRAHGRVTQQSLDSLRDGIAVEGILYGSIEATLDHEQGANTWLNVALREGKNREVKKVLGHLGLEVNRLIRVSFGPFQLGELPTGAIREIRSRTLREQLGNKLITESNADFDAPIVNIAPEIPRSEKKVADRQKKVKQQKAKRGVAKDGVLERMTTSLPRASRSGKKDSGRPSPKSRNKRNRSD